MITADNIILRSWNEEDISSIIQNANNKKIWNNLRDEFPYPYTENDAKKWIKYANQQKPLTNLAIDYMGNAIGGIGIIIKKDVFRRNAEIGYWIGEKYWHKGFGTKALNMMVKYAFNTFNLVRLYAYVFESNIASVKVLEKCGFVNEARLKKSVLKNEKIIDCFIFSLINENYKIPNSKNNL